MDYLGELILNLLGLRPDPIENLREAVAALSRQPTVEFFNPNYLMTYGLAFGIALFVSLAVSLLSVMRNLRPGVSAFRTVLAFGYYGETLVIGSVLLFVAQWLDTTIAAGRATVFGLLPDDVQHQFILSLQAPQMSMFYKIVSGIATGGLKIEADILNNMTLLLSMAFIIVYPLYHLEVGPRDTFLRWLLVALGGTLASMLWLVGGAVVLNSMLSRTGPVQPTDFRSYSTAVLFLAAFAPFMLNSYLKRTRMGQRIMGAITVRNVVSTRGPVSTPAPVKGKPGGVGSRIDKARTSEARSQWVSSAAKRPENLLKLSGTTRPIGSAISAARGLKRK